MRFYIKCSHISRLYKKHQKAEKYAVLHKMFPYSSPFPTHLQEKNLCL